MGKSSPKAPAPPDYAAANREGIYADIETLPIRRLIDYATRAGTAVTYNDPSTGKPITADFTGKGDIDLAKLASTTMGETALQEAGNQLAVQRQYGSQFQDEALKALERQDPAGFAARKELASGLRNEYSTGADPRESDTSRLLRDAAVSESLRTQVGDTGDNELLRMGRDAALRQSLSDYQLGGSLSGEQQRGIEQSVRGAAAARGQALSGGAALNEVIGKYNMGEQLRQQRLGNLMNVGQQVFGQETGLAGARNNQAQLRLANLFNAQNTQFGQEGQMRQEAMQQQQRRLSNLSSYVMGQPISSQYQSLAGAQQGASPYSPVMAQGIGQNAGAGGQSAQFAGNIFGTQAQMYGTQMANQSDPLATIGGGLLGAATGGFGTMFGAGMAGKLLGGGGKGSGPGSGDGSLLRMGVYGPQLK